MGIRTQGQIKKAINSIRRSNQFGEKSVANLEATLKLGLEVKRKAKKNIECSSVFKEDLKEGIEQVQPIADLSKIAIDKDFLKSLFHRVCEVTLDFEDQKKDEVLKINRAIQNERIDFDKLKESLVFGKNRYFASIAKKLGTSKEILYSIALMVFRPIFELAAEKEKHLIKDYEWKKGYCPICGGRPKMAKLEKEVGRRYLWCPLCGSEWVYRRVKCPFCENENQELLRFFYLDEKSPYRVDVCDKCKGYIKTVDERKRSNDEKTIFEIEDSRTLFLDKIAAKEGFKHIKILGVRR